MEGLTTKFPFTNSSPAHGSQATYPVGGFSNYCTMPGCQTEKALEQKTNTQRRSFVCWIPAFAMHFVPDKSAMKTIIGK